jgi:small-conductance mechanosensitive channel
MATALRPCWIAFLCSNIKGWLLGVIPKQQHGQDQRKIGRKLVYNRLADFGLGVVAVIAALDSLTLELGVALGSLLAVGGLSSVVFALALKEPLSHLVNGLLVTFSDKFRVHDEVSFESTAGEIINMGWFDTSVRKHDESVVIIPNGDIMGKPLVNLSRMTLGQFKADISLPYSALDKVGEVIASIKEELARLPGIVISPDRPISVHWRFFEKSRINVVVDAKIRHRGGSPSYLDCCEQANFGIARALRRCGIEFV